MLRFPYQDEPLVGPPPPSLSPASTVRWRPLVPVTIFGQAGLYLDFARAILDPGADDTIFPDKVVLLIDADLLADTGHRLRWRGQLHPLRFAKVELSLSDAMQLWRWPATVAFTPAPITYPILGNGGCLQFFDACFRGEARLVELETNASFPGTTI
jgi:hypothetical protein